MRRVLILLTALFFALLVASCAYVPDVQQGNAFDDKQLAQLKTGMTRQQVIFLMGTPLLKDPFHRNRWDYVHTYKKGKGKTRRRLLTLYFKGNRLDRIDRSQLKEVILD